MTDRLIVRRGYIIMIIGLENVTDSYHYLVLYNLLTNDHPI